MLKNQKSSKFQEVFINSGIDEKRGYELIHNSFDINEKLLGPNNKKNTLLMPYLAREKYEFGEFDEAERILKKNIDVKIKIFGNLNVSVAFSYNHLADFQNNSREYKVSPSIQFASSKNISKYNCRPEL